MITVEKLKRRVYMALVTVVIAEIMDFIIEVVFQIRLEVWLVFALLIPGYLLAKLSWESLPPIWDGVVGSLSGGGSGFSGAEEFGLKQVLFLIAVCGFLFYNITDGFLAFANWYMNRNSPEGIRTNYDGLSMHGVIFMTAVSIALTLFLWNRLHRSAFFQTCAAAISLVLAVGAAVWLCGVSQIGMPSSELMDQVLEDALVGKIMPISFPDTGVLRWAVPSIVLSYYGWNSSLGGVAKRGRRIAFVCALLSATAVCTGLRMVVWKVFH